MFLWLKPQAILFEISRFSTNSRRDEIFIDNIYDMQKSPVVVKYMPLLWSFFVSISNIARGFNHGDMGLDTDCFLIASPWLKPRAMLI